MANDKDIKLNVQADVSLNNLDEIEKLQKQIQSIAQTMLGLEKFNPIGANEEEIKKVFSLISEITQQFLLCQAQVDVSARKVPYIVPL